MNREEFENKVMANVRAALANIGVNNAVMYFPMLRKEGNKLFIASLVQLDDEELYEENKTIRPRYWALLDVNSFEVIEVNNTKDKDYMQTDLIPIEQKFADLFSLEGKNLAKYAAQKRVQYTDYLTKDIKNDLVETQMPILKAINNKVIIDNTEINATDYLISNVEKDIDDKVGELVSLIVDRKYSAIIYYYGELIMDIIAEYNTNQIINLDKMKLAKTIIDTYYGPYCGIEYLFNI